MNLESQVYETRADIVHRAPTIAHNFCMAKDAHVHIHLELSQPQQTDGVRPEAPN